MVHQKVFKPFLNTIAFLVLAILSGCAPIIATPSASSFDAPLNVENDSSLFLKSGDVVKITVYGEDAMTGEFPVNPQGDLRLPLAGVIHAEGLSESRLEKEIAEILQKGGFIKNPSVTVDIASLRPFYVAGEVSKPDRYDYHPDMTVFQAIATAGGYTPRAAKNRILIDRKQQDKTIRLNARENTPILPGDSIIVRERIL